MNNIFETICKKCNGQCCKTIILLMKRDVDRLNEQGLQFRIKNEETGTETPPGYMTLCDGKCPFLSEGKGCTLKPELKPFDCIFFHWRSHTKKRK